MTDVPALLVFGGVLLAIVATGEGVRAWAGWAAESSRRLVHALTGIAVAVAIPWFDTPAPLYVLAAAFVLVNSASVSRGWFPGMHGIKRRSIGTVTFPLALLFALLTCWTLDPSRVPIIPIAFIVLALADPLASLVGTRMRRPGRYMVGANEKSLAGSASFFGAAWVIIGVGLWVAPVLDLPQGHLLLLVAFVVAGLATCAEAVAGRGWDNLFIVVAVVAPLAWLHQFPDALGSVVLAAAVALIFAALVVALRFLTLDGALAASALAFFVVAFGGWAWALPAFAFFFLASALSKFGRARKRSAEALAEKGSTRDAGQVYANGGVAWMLLLAFVFFPEAEFLYWGFLGAFAAAAADTWGTEVGTLVRGPTRQVWNGRRVPPGTSGGVSVAGTLGGLVGAATVFAVAWPVLGRAVSPPGMLEAGVLIIGAGLVASAVDSLLGATLQIAFRDPETDLWTERRLDPPAERRGWRWLTNDRVNLICTAVGAAIPILTILSL